MRTNIKQLVAYAVVPAILLAFVAVLVDGYGPAFWVGIGFVAFAYVVLLASKFFVAPGRERVILGFTQAYVALVYFAVTFVLNLVFIFFGSLPWKGALLLNALVTGAFLLVSMAASIAADKTVADSARTRVDHLFVRTLTADLEALAARAGGDRALATRIGRLAETAKYAPVQSTASASGVEVRIQEHVRAAEAGLGSADPADLDHALAEIEALLSTRARLIKSEL